MQSDSFSVVLNSTKYLSRTNRSSIQYGIDWSFMPQGQYSMSWKFSSKASTESKLLLIEFIAGCNLHSYTAGSSTNAIVNNFIGSVSNIYPGNVAGYFKSDYADNPPLFLASKPTDSMFYVNIYDNDLALYDIAVDYVLILTFKKIE
jgi:hypothetical protein